MRILPHFTFAFCLVFFLGATAYSANLDFTVNTTEAVTVTGSPRLSLTVGAAARFATYNAGASTATALVFRYAVAAGDFDADGVAITSPVDLNGGTIRDAGGNNLTLTYTAPNTAGVKVQTYQVVFTTDPITAANETAAAFQMTKAPVGATFNYSISSAGGGSPVTGSGTIATATQNVTGINVSTLPPGTLTVSLTMTDAFGAMGTARTDTVTGAAGALDTLTAEAAYSVRRLRTAYTSPILRVRRSSDNTEQDIGATYAGELNTSALTTFCGANSCFVTTLYDQSGNTRNATQTTPGNQPRIVNAGTMETQNTKPSLRGFAGSATTSLQVPQAGWGSPTGWSYSAVGRTSIDPPGNSTATGPYLSLDCQGANTHHPWTDGVIYDAFGSNTRKTTVNPATTLNQLNVYTVISETNNWASYLNNASLYTTGTNAFCTTLTNQPLLMASFGGYHLDGFVSEAVIFTSGLSSGNRNTLTANQKSYFGTP